MIPYSRILILVILINVLFFVSSNSAAEWQKKYNYIQVREKFNQPPLFYAPHTFWFWDAPLDKSLTASMAREMAAKRLNPGYAHPRHSGDQHKPYPTLPVDQWLSPLWFESFGTALSEAQTVGMTLGYCDEYWWPSGQAAGRVLKKNPELAAQSLEWNKQIVSGPDQLELPASKFTVAGQLSEKGRINASTLRIIGEDQAFKWNIPDGKWVVYSYNTYYHPGVDGGEVNYLDNRLMDTFIPIAHESYEKHFKDQMGNTIPGVFVDNEGDFGWQMAWSEFLAKRYMEMKDRDIRLWLPLLTEEDDEGLWAKARYDWFDVVSDVYSKQYLGRLSDWLSDRDMYCISNLWEEDLMLQTRAVGDFMRAQRTVTMPGNDCLQMKSQQVHDFKETQSVCEFEDKPFMSELMGVAGWEQTPVQMKMTLNSVTAFGITHNVPHGINLNRILETIPYPADWYTENPYWHYMHLWTDFARRASFVNRQGKLVADILLINPLESVWALSEGYFTGVDGNQWPEKAKEINEVYSIAMDSLTARRLDFLIADRHYMNKARVVKTSTQQKASLNIADHDFSVIVLSPMIILSRSTSEKILKFARAGGSVFILGSLPEGSPETGAKDQQIVKDMEDLVKLPSVINLADTRNNHKLLADRIESAIEKQVEIISGTLPLTIAHRKIDNKNFYWLVNNTDRNEKMRLSFRDGSGGVEIWDCEKGEIRAVVSKSQKNRTVVDLQIDPYQAFWLVIDSDKPVVKIGDQSRPAVKELVLTEPWQFSFPETQVIETTSARTLITTDTNHVSAYLDTDYNDSEWRWLNITGPVRIADTWRASLLHNPKPESDRYYRYKFVLKEKPDGALININADNEVWFWVNEQAVKPGPNSSNLTDADLHDIGSILKKGENIIAVKTSNRPGYGSMIFQGTVQLADGSTFDILSGIDWKESTEEASGWQKFDFDDTRWGKAITADLKMQERDLHSMREPVMVSFTKSVAWWRMNLPPGTKEVGLSGLAKSAKIWIDGKSVILDKNKLNVSDGSKVMVVKIYGNESGLTQPAEFHCQSAGLTRPGSWLKLGLRNFTGFAEYETQVNLQELTSHVFLDLGKVLHMAEVWVNDKKVGERLWPPFKFDLSKVVKKGNNKIRVRIGNLMVNSMGIKDDLGTLRHWGWDGVPDDTSFDAGLFGPVKIILTN